MRSTAFAAMLASMAMLCACSDRADTRRSNAVVLVVTGHRAADHPKFASGSTATVPAEMPGIPEGDMQIEPPAAIAALHDADPYRIADADLSVEGESTGGDVTT